MEVRGYEQAYLKAKVTASGIAMCPRKKTIPTPIAPSNPPKVKESFHHSDSNQQQGTTLNGTGHKNKNFRNNKDCKVHINIEEMKNKEISKENKNTMMKDTGGNLNEANWQLVKSEAMNMNKSNRRNFFDTKSENNNIIKNL